MKANAVPLIALFEKKLRLEVPLFQRPYVWSEDQQWAPLWEDIERKFIDYLEGRLDIPVHFLGAIVLDQKQTPATHVERRLVIDGQQRLTTLQVFLNAFRDFCRSVNALALAEECANYTVNKGMMPDPKVDKFKVWPTQLDRPAFIDVVESESPDALKARYPLIKKKYARKPEPRPQLVECYLYFFRQLDEFFHGSLAEPPLVSNYAIDHRLEQCFQALRSTLMVVAIDLEQGDDAQVIFETLNARGQALLPADLLRNFVFLRATRNGEAAEKLYESYWAGFDAPYWQEAVSQGRLNRPRSDLFMQHFLVSQQVVDVPIGHLYVEYRHWIERKNPFANVKEELVLLSKSRENFRMLLDAEPGKPFSSLARFLRSFDIGTAYPLMLQLLEAETEENGLLAICSIIESYLMRRSVCMLTNKNYNRVFLQLAKILKKEAPTPDVVADYLRELRGDSTEWPTDVSFRSAWSTREIYTSLSSPRLIFLLSKLNESFVSSKTETIVINGSLSVEHIMPQEWVPNWPLPNGSAGADDSELWTLEPDDQRFQSTIERNRLVQTIGNLTVVRPGLNSALSNGSWIDKRTQLTYSILPINILLQSLESWDENAIRFRSDALFERALNIWPR